MPEGKIMREQFVNEFISSLSGDFDETGSNWNSGLLSGNNVHPTEISAKVLTNQLLIDSNEIIN